MTGLATLVQDILAMDPFSTQLFVFTNRRQTQCRILYWERCGFVLWHKRLERVRFAYDGCYGIDTNPVKNAIRPFCLGRRSWLFSDTVTGAQASARLYSLLRCAKANGLEPYAYLRRVFTGLPNAQSLAGIEALLSTRLNPADLI